MRRHMHAFAGPLLAVALLGGALVPPAFAQETVEPPPEGGSGNDNTVVAINTHDWNEIFRVGFKITRVTGEVVDAGNAAVAFSSCSNCETIAAAYQVVLIFSTPPVVITENIAFAFNLNCDTCVSVAYAYQGVFTTGGPVHFTAEGNRLLAELRQELEQLRNAELSLQALVAKLEEFALRLEEIVRTELVSAGPTPDAEASQELPAELTDSPSPSPSPTQEESPSPSPTEEQSPSPSPTEEESPSPSPSPEESPSPTGSTGA